MQTAERTWWARPGLEVRDGRLAIAGRDAEQLAREHGTPVFVHDLVAAREQATTLRDAMADAGLRFRIRLALKAQRDPDFLRFLREETPFVGVDVCSPGETEWALAHGWAPEEISYTGTNVSEATSTACCPPVSTSTSICSPSSNASAGAPPARRSGSA